MSYTTFYGVRKDGSTQALMTQRNSWLYGYRVWEELWKRYCPETNPDAIKYGYSTMMSNTPRLWALHHDIRLSRGERLALLSTFDMVWIPKAIHGEVAAGVRALGATLPTELDERMAMKEWHGWCAQMTSVGEDTWEYRSPSGRYQRNRNVYKGPAFQGQMPWPITDHKMIKEKSDEKSDQ